MKKIGFLTITILFFVLLSYGFMQLKNEDLKERVLLKKQTEFFLKEFNSTIRYLDGLAIKSSLNTFSKNHAKKPLVATMINKKWTFIEGDQNHPYELGYFFKSNLQKINPYWVKISATKTHPELFFRVLPTENDVKVFQVQDFEKTFFSNACGLDIKFCPQKSPTTSILFFDLLEPVAEETFSIFELKKASVVKNLDGFEDGICIRLNENFQLRIYLLWSTIFVLGLLKFGILVSFLLEKRYLIPTFLFLTTFGIFLFTGYSYKKIKTKATIQEKNAFLAIETIQKGTTQFSEHVESLGKYLCECFNNDLQLMASNDLFTKWPYLKKVRIENEEKNISHEISTKTSPDNFLNILFHRFKGWELFSEDPFSDFYFCYESSATRLILQIDPYPILRPKKIIESLYNYPYSLSREIDKTSPIQKIKFSITPVNSYNIHFVQRMYFYGYLFSTVGLILVYLWSVFLGFFSSTLHTMDLLEGSRLYKKQKLG